MGIPSYFSQIIRDYPHILKKVVSSLKIQNFYLDSNSIIYDVYHNIKIETLNDTITSHIIKQVILKIEEYVSILNPTNTVLIAFDGVAPVAKLEQQRIRRYKSWYQNRIHKQIYNTTNEDPWNTASITPGTKFMKELNTIISSHFNKKNTDSGLKYIFSGSDQFGEGEHKIFEYIRKNNSHLNETTIVYGLDADLIMLAINHLHLCPNLYLYRETPQFIKSINSDLEPNSNYFVDIPEFSKSLGEIMGSNEKLHDYIFMCFILGNDFMPHFPAINIRTGGIHKLMNAYKETVKNNEFITNGLKINWNIFRKFVALLESQEEQFLQKEHKQRDAKEKRGSPETTDDEKYSKFENLPQYERDMEKYINPFKSYWRTRYNKALLDIHHDFDNEKIKRVCINYLEGLEWTLKYYSQECPNWRWKYNYHYPPLLSDLIKYIPVFDTTFMPILEPKPVSQLVQLCYVLPRGSLNLLPTPIYYELLKYDWYKENFDFIWAYCSYFWESHVDMPHIQISDLEYIIHKKLNYNS
jgi:5'-3' exonuclease